MPLLCEVVKKQNGKQSSSILLLKPTTPRHLHPSLLPETKWSSTRYYHLWRRGDRTGEFLGLFLLSTILLQAHGGRLNIPTGDEEAMITLTGLDHHTFDHHSLINNLNNKSMIFGNVLICNATRGYQSSRNTRNFDLLLQKKFLIWKKISDQELWQPLLSFGCILLLDDAKVIIAVATVP
jgi:hypothetical protein